MEKLIECNKCGVCCIAYNIYICQFCELEINLLCMMFNGFGCSNYRKPWKVTGERCKYLTDEDLCSLHGSKDGMLPKPKPCRDYPVNYICEEVNSFKGRFDDKVNLMKKLIKEAEAKIFENN